MSNAIPPITDELGKYWSQPDPAGILLDDTHALMDQKTFHALAEYSCTMPTGVYRGKMWKRHDGIHTLPTAQCVWLLMWYDVGEPDGCTINWRRILIV